VQFYPKQTTYMSSFLRLVRVELKTVDEDISRLVLIKSERTG
jgi:hypothetical protein